MNVGRYLRGEDRHIGTARIVKAEKPFSDRRELHLRIVNNVGAFHFTGCPLGVAITADCTVADRKGVYTEFYELLMCIDAPEYISAGTRPCSGILIGQTVIRGQSLS